MAKTKPILRSGPDLLDFLTHNHPNLPIKWIAVSGEVVGVVDKARAVVMVKGGEFVGKCGCSRVFYIREVVDERQPNTADSSYWDDRACGLYRWVKDKAASSTTLKSAAAWDTYGIEVEG